VILAPGTILQLMYFKERLRRIKPGYFIEMGVGRGDLSKVLLDHGWRGRGYELNPQAAQAAKHLNREAVDQGRYQVLRTDWLRSGRLVQADLVVSSMVLEHLNEKDEAKYFQKAWKALKPEGRMILLVPACPDYWGLEDEIAGHYRRYTARELEAKARKSGWKIVDRAGLCYPLCNWLFPISDLLVKRSESGKRKLSMTQRTKLSGYREVPFKTLYPWVFKFVLNPVVLYPFHWLQKMYRENSRCIVLYGEFTRAESRTKAA